MAAILGFLLRATVESWLASQPRSPRYLAWAVLFGIGFFLTAILPLIQWDRWILLPLGAGIALGPIGLQAIRWLRIRGRLLGEAVVVGSLSLLAPAVVYAGTGEFDKWTGFLWLPVALYLWGGITYVRMSLVSAAKGATRSQIERRRTAALYHASLPLALAAAVAGGVMPALATLAYIPMMSKAVRALWGNVRAVQVRRLGIWEAIHAGVFAALLIALYRLAE